MLPMKTDPFSDREELRKLSVATQRFTRSGYETLFRASQRERSNASINELK